MNEWMNEWKFGSEHAKIDKYTNSTFKVQKGRGLGLRDPISKFLDRYNFRMNQTIRFKFGTEVEDGPFMRTDHKITP